MTTPSNTKAAPAKKKSRGGARSAEKMPHKPKGIARKQASGARGHQEKVALTFSGFVASLPEHEAYSSAKAFWPGLKKGGALKSEDGEILITAKQQEDAKAECVDFWGRFVLDAIEKNDVELFGRLQRLAQWQRDENAEGDPLGKAVILAAACIKHEGGKVTSETIALFLNTQASRRNATAELQSLKSKGRLTERKRDEIWNKALGREEDITDSRSVARFIKDVFGGLPEMLAGLRTLK
jgi:hypothetical protein